MNEARDTLLECISAAFHGRLAPAVLSDSLQLSDLEYEEVMAFEGRHWRDVDFALVERCADAVFWFAPEAFCFYLPGIMAAGVRAGRCDTNAHDALIGCLDRSPEPANWDAFFLPRWPLLNAAELDAVAAWVTWLEAVQPAAFHANTYEGARATLRLLRLQAS